MGQCNALSKCLSEPSYSGLTRVSPKLTGAQDTRVKPEYDGIVVM
ncbi:hypothetical protein HMPREF9370_2523 [Neisseria wadsworthii 9715]|uniref:Uncharacterized protein n=1 Tax=Neisseria wadsworthii 9715 TaxID=1030841 RepID=G4CTW3_9NEIS|nr:hypothetical protein HMPREF9370_2523 [Neisseria wadsworthii 9715]